MYTWMDQWAVLPEDPLGWMHSGAAVVNVHIVVAHPGKPALLSYTPDGDLERTVELEGLLEPQGFCPTKDGLWIDDVGFKRHRAGPTHETEKTRGRVVLVDDVGAVKREINDPGAGWSPTDVVVVEESGEIWVTDEYGHDLVHRFAADGAHLRARVTILDKNDQLIEHIGANPEAPKRDGWPNARNAEGNLVRPPLEAGMFNSPHTEDGDGRPPTRPLKRGFLLSHRRDSRPPSSRSPHPRRT